MFSELDSVQEALARADTAAERVRLSARAACLMARCGQLDAARRAVDQAQRRVDGSAELLGLGVLLPDVLYAKAMLRLTSDQPDEAARTLQAGRQLALACGRRDLLPRFDALLAMALVHCAQLERAAEVLQSVAATRVQHDRETLCLARLALGQALMADERFDDALATFGAAHQSALRGRDLVSAAEVLHWIAECEVTALEADERRGALVPERVSAALVDTESAAKLGQQAGMMQAGAAAAIQRARLMVLQHRVSGAAGVLRTALSTGASAGLSRSEIARARALLARCVAAERTAPAAEQARALIHWALSGLPETPIDTCLASHRLAAQVFELLDDDIGWRDEVDTGAQLYGRFVSDLARARDAIERAARALAAA